MTDDGEAETTGDSGDESENRPKPEFEGQTVLAGDSKAGDDSSTDSE